VGPPGFRGEECKILKPGFWGGQGFPGLDGPPGVCVWSFGEEFSRELRWMAVCVFV